MDGGSRAHTPCLSCSLGLLADRLRLENLPQVLGISKAVPPALAFEVTSSQYQARNSCGTKNNENDVLHRVSSL